MFIANVKAKLRAAWRKRRLVKLEQQGITEEEHLEQKTNQRRKRDLKKSSADFQITSTPTTSTDRRSLRKRKEAPANVQENDSGDCGIGDDGEFKVDVSTKSDDDDDVENLSDDAGTKKKKSCSNQDNTKQKQEGSAAVTKDAEIDDDDEADRPIRTQNWGYSHTKKSKIKISIANKGNVPWNKGKTRSAEEKVSFISFRHFYALKLFTMCVNSFVHAHVFCLGQYKRRCAST